MKFWICLLILLLDICCAAYAAEPLRVQNFEGEARIGLAVGLGWHKGMRGDIGPAFGLELRQNIKMSAWDVGLILDGVQGAVSEPRHNGNDRYHYSNRVVSVAAVGDYNFRQGRKINPFAGIGFGAGFYDQPVENDISGCLPVIIPRVGVELVHHIRLTASFHIIRNGFNAFDVSLGFVIGGRPKKQILP